MALDAQQVQEIAHLARLSIAEGDVPDYVDNLSEILSFVEQLGSVDTDGVEPMAHPLDMAQRLRPDNVTETDQRLRFQALAPAAEGGLYLVPRVIE